MRLTLQECRDPLVSSLKVDEIAKQFEETEIFTENEVDDITSSMVEEDRRVAFLAKMEHKNNPKIFEKFLIALKGIGQTDLSDLLSSHCEFY